MHLEFDEAIITALKCATCRVTGLDELVDDAARPVDCFVVEGLRMFLDNMTHMAAPDRS